MPALICKPTLESSSRVAREITLRVIPKINWLFSGLNLFDPGHTARTESRAGFRNRACLEKMRDLMGCLVQGLTLRALLQMNLKLTMLF